MDVHNAFLNGDLLEKVYMSIHSGFARQGENGTKVCKLHKSLYGLKQAPRQWNFKLTQVLIQLGFHQSQYDYSLFIKHEQTDIVIVLVYVDDLLITGSRQSLIDTTKEDLQKQFKMKDLGDLKFFLGIECARSSRGIHMSQRKYALERIAECGLGGARPVATPLEQNEKLTSVQFDECIKLEKKHENPILQNPSRYQRLVGRLLYLTMTRPDLSFSVQVLSQYMHSPKESHMEEALRVVRYIKEAPDLGLFMPAENTSQLLAYCDSDWGSCSETRRSVTGYLVKFGGALISWKSKKQEIVSRSSAEAEFKSMANSAAEITWLVGLFKEFGVHIELPVTMVCDSKAAIQIAANPIFHERTKRIDIDCHHVREKICQGLLKTQYTNTMDQLTDLLTKGLGKAQHQLLMNDLGMMNLFKP
ncbi:uncharacterized mitochondrial protein AtMg00810-like [Solanum tuberosum]|uniref:uncharacterized mitochondrial protein AtMg00810-like n=1 Tax=Solanum tuberosum TaxID=4113 RepID=UPI00073A22D7|nr:PREDICTED: uncharacterized mitochondrial protein AtMg00810-like [Solanum tuberosum]